MMTMDMEQARFNMIEQQIRPAEVLDPRVLEVIAQVRREDFVPEAYRELAFSDTNIPLGNGEVMMKPIMEARLLQALDVQPTDKILEIGTGSGYFTALLARLGKRVHSVEIDPTLMAQAEAKLAAHNIGNVSLTQGDAARDWNQDAPFDVIAITGSLPLLPETFQQLLTIGGRMAVIVGQAPVMEAKLITRVGDDQWATEDLFETVLPALRNAEQPQAFVF
jgi:protein-L-isoaspartate(D-aspartate) O-methyltransferase